MRIIGIETDGLGINNQMRGIVIQGAKMRKKGEKTPVSRDSLLKAVDGTLLHPRNFKDSEALEKAVQASIDAFLAENKAPEFVVLPLDHSHKHQENEDVDTLSLAVKKAFAARGYNVKTMVLASNLYDYQNIDLIHVGKHLLTPEDEKVLAQNPALKSRVVETLGVPSNISWTSIRNYAHRPVIEKILTKYRSYKKVLAGKKLCGKEAFLQEKKKQKNVLFSLGGITDDGAIKFDLTDAVNLMQAAATLKFNGYNIIFTNSPRTPSDITDYLYEKCQIYHMDFFNSKKIAQTKEEAENFRNYSGKHKEEFIEQAEKIGNIYPAILDVCEFVINTHDSFSYTSDAAALGIPSVVYTGNYIDKERRPDCYKLFDLCHKGKYVISLEEALEKIKRNEKLKTKRMTNVSTQLIRAMSKCLANGRQNFKTPER